jgi:hypothetical protein
MGLGGAQQYGVDGQTIEEFERHYIVKRNQKSELIMRKMSGQLHIDLLADRPVQCRK